MTELVVPFHKSNIDLSLAMSRLQEVIESGWLTSGKYMAELERKFKQKHSLTNAVAVNSATNAALMVLHALRIKEGDQVIFPSLTFSGPPMMARLLGADVVFADIDPETLMLDSQSVEGAMTGRTKAVVVTHYGGKIDPNIDELADVCKRNGVHLIEDAAHCHPTKDSYNRNPGSWGKAAFYSFYANKTVPAGEGGMIVTNDNELAARLRITRLHGFDKDAMQRFQTSKVTYDVSSMGFKANMSDVVAAIALTSLDGAEDDLLRREQVAKMYCEKLTTAKCRMVQSTEDADRSSWHLAVVKTKNRPALIDNLRRYKIGHSIHYRPLHQHTYWQNHRLNQFRVPAPALPATNSCADMILSLPIYPAMKPGTIDTVLRAIRG